MSKTKLLLADDSVTIQKVVNLTFADEGIEVIAVGDGNSAVSAFIENEPDIVLADVSMPGLSGYEVCERIRRGNVRAGVPVILLVGSFEQFDETKAAQVGASAHITKPFSSIRNLVTMVNSLLAQSSAASAFAEIPAAAVPPVVAADELIEAYRPDPVYVPAPPAAADDILSGSELDSILGGSAARQPVIDDFDILDIPMGTASKPAVQPAPAPAAPPPPYLSAEAPFDATVPRFQSPAMPFEATMTEFGTPVVAAAQPAPQQAVPTLSRADIEAIAASLSQRLSEDVIREIALKIVPEVTAKIIEKMVEQAAARR